MISLKSRSTFLAFFVFLISILVELRVARFNGIRLEFIAFFLLMALYVFIYIIRNRLIFSFRKTHIGFIGACYIVFLITSTAWSSDPKESFFHSLVYLMVILFVGLRGDIDKKIFFDTIIRCTFLLALFSWLFYLAFGDLALSPKDVTWRLKGFLGHEQRLAIFMSLGILLMVIGRCKYKAEYPILYYAAIFLTLFATQARAFIAFTTIIVSVIVLIEARVRLKIALIILSLMLLSIGTYFLSDFIDLVSRGEADVTLTGRTTIWEYTLIKAKESIIFGHGFASFSSDGIGDEIFVNYVAPHAHNTVVQSLFEVGALGTLFLLLWLYKLAKSNDHHCAGYSSYLIAFCFLCGLMGIVFGTKINGILILVLYLISVDKDRVRRNL